MSKFITTIQRILPEVAEWSARNFPNGSPYDPFEGIVEEIGELAHARLKGRQGIRGTPDEHRAAELDALCDICIFAFDYLARNNINLHMFLESLAGETEDRGPGFQDRAITAEVLFADTLRKAGNLAYYTVFHFPGGGRTAPLDAVGAKNALFCVSSILASLWVYAHLRHGVDLADELDATWARVKKRDWLADPLHATETTGTASATVVVAAEAAIG